MQHYRLSKFTHIGIAFKAKNMCNFISQRSTYISRIETLAILSSRLSVLYSWSSEDILTSLTVINLALLTVLELKVFLITGYKLRCDGDSELTPSIRKI